MKRFCRTVCCLLKSDSPVMAKSSSDSKDPLHFAAWRGDMEAVVSLLKQCQDIDAVDREGWTVLHHACFRGFFSIAKLLLDNGASVHSAVISTGQTVLHMAVGIGKEDIVALLLRNGADVHAMDKQGFTALLCAAQRLNENIVKQLLSCGADISTVSPDGHTALSFACWNGRPQDNLANFLIECGADVHWVGTDPSNRGYTLVHFAAQNRMIETIQLLLDRKVDVNAVTDDGITALHMACEWQAPDSVECLLRNGAKVSYPCPDGYTALHFAALGSRREDQVFGYTAELLFKYGADVDAEDEKGRTPLDLALYVSHTEMFKVFVKQLMNMKGQGLFVSENNLKAISENEEAMLFSTSCEEEIDWMRKRAIGDSSVNFYDLLTKGENRLADFMSNENVERVLESENYKVEFPIYAGAICEKFLQGRERRDLLRKSSDWLWAVINEFYQLPYVCVLRINRYLMNPDLALQISSEPGADWP